MCAGRRNPCESRTEGITTPVLHLEVGSGLVHLTRMGTLKGAKSTVDQKGMLAPLWGYHKPWAGPRSNSFAYRGCGIWGCGKPRTKPNLPGLTQSREKKKITRNQNRILSGRTFLLLLCFIFFFQVVMVRNKKRLWFSVCISRFLF